MKTLKGRPPLARPSVGLLAGLLAALLATPCAAADEGLSAPQLPALKPPPGAAPSPRRLTFGAQFRRAREAAR